MLYHLANWITGLQIPHRYTWRLCTVVPVVAFLILVVSPAYAALPVVSEARMYPDERQWAAYQAGGVGRADNGVPRYPTMLVQVICARLGDNLTGLREAVEGR